MSSKKAFSRLRTLINSVLVGGLVLFIAVYAIVARPEYKFINGLAHTFVPVANAVGDLVTWPLRAGGRIVKRIHSVAKLEEENEELRAKLALYMNQNNNCNIAIAENNRLSRELGVARSIGYSTVVADVVHDNSAINHETFFINRGTSDGIAPGMVAVSFDETLVGVVIDAGTNFARIRGLSDSGTNIAVRIAGSDVYGFLRGNGLLAPSLGFLSNHNFRVEQGTKLVSSNISGILPNGIYIGQMKNETDVDVLSPSQLSRVMILKFNTADNKYR